MGEERGNIAFFSTYRPPVPLDIYSSPLRPKSKDDEDNMTDGVSYNYNGQEIPARALKTILRNTSLGSEADAKDVDSGRVTGMIFVSERDDLELLYIKLMVEDEEPSYCSLAELYGTNEFSGVRMEDSGCFAGHYLIYISTKEDPGVRRQPWTAVYRTNLRNGETIRLTPEGEADLSPSVSPSGKQIAVASYENKGGWDGEIENLQTDIYVMDVADPSDRELVVSNGGWPTWGSDDVIFFHRGLEVENNNGLIKWDWGVYRANISNGFTSHARRVTPNTIMAMTPAAIDETTVAVATIRQSTKFKDGDRDKNSYRHIEIFDSTNEHPPRKITRKINPMADHYNPFVINDGDEERIGYHRCNIHFLNDDEDVIVRQFQTLQSPLRHVGLFRVSGVFPTISPDGSKLAYVDNEFKNVWLADDDGLRIIYEYEGEEAIFSPVWSQNPDMDTLYVCVGPAFKARDSLSICAIKNVCSGRARLVRLTKDYENEREKINPYNNAFPSTNPEGTKLVFRSTRDGGTQKHKNLYILENAEKGELNNSRVRRLTRGNCTDTHCQWSTRGDWIVFSSTRKKPDNAEPLDNGLDPGYFAVYIVNAYDPSVLVRVVASGDDFSGHINHPCFSPDGRSIVVAADLAGVSADPISLPIIDHSVRSYGDIFTINIDLNNIYNNKDVKRFKRITHSRYENSTATWTPFTTVDPYAEWNKQLSEPYKPSFPIEDDDDGVESWQMTGHLCLARRCC